MAGGTTKGSARESALDPATPLTLREAAVLVGVDEASLDARCDDGSLIYETQRRGRKNVRVVRVIDLAEVFPEVLGGAAGTTEQTEVDETVVAVESMAEAVRASGASRDALIELCQDMETRLDLAERERQASTASLLMAQRRVLDLELQVRSRPWTRAGGAMLGLLSVSAILLALRAPSLVERATAEQAASLRLAVSGDLATVTERVEGIADASSAERESLAARVSTSADAVAAGQQAVEELARNARLQRDEAAAERDKRQAVLAELQGRLDAADAEARKRAAELDLLVDSSSRDRARFAERLAAAERAADDARAQLAAERRASADERATFERTLTDLLRDHDEDAERQSQDLRAMREAVQELIERQPKEPSAAETALEVDEAPDTTWWGRTLRAFFGA